MHFWSHVDKAKMCFGDLHLLSFSAVSLQFSRMNEGLHNTFLLYQHGEEMHIFRVITIWISNLWFVSSYTKIYFNIFSGPCWIHIKKCSSFAKIPKWRCISWHLVGTFENPPSSRHQVRYRISLQRLPQQVPSLSQTVWWRFQIQTLQLAIQRRIVWKRRTIENFLWV